MTDYFEGPTADQHRRSRIGIKDRHESEAVKEMRARRKRVDELYALLEMGVAITYDDIEPWKRWK